MDKEEVCSFFLNRGFVQDESTASVICITGKELFLNGMLPSERKAAALTRSAYSFDMMTPDMLMAAAADMNLVDKNSILKAEKNHSFVCEKSGAYVGMLISEKIGRDYFLREFIAEDDEYRRILTLAFVYSFMKEMRCSERIVIDDNVVDESALREVLFEVRRESLCVLRKH
jgi:hypothetical protein